MTKIIDIKELTQRLIDISYPELGEKLLKIEWGSGSSFATISWSTETEKIEIKCNRETQRWPEAAITGLLAHELSHPAQHKKKQSESSTDFDALERGFGPYLCVERLFAGKYEDHIINRGKDRYLGYRTIRGLLNEIELNHLDKLLIQLHLIPSKETQPQKITHDIVIRQMSEQTMILVGGHEFLLDRLVLEPVVQTVTRENTTHVIVNKTEVGTFEINVD
jgi:hypothetical protein